MATQLNQTQAQNSDKLPSQTVENLRNVSAITLRSRKNIEVPTPEPTPPKEVDLATLQRKHDARWMPFRKVEVNIPLLDAIK